MKCKNLLEMNGDWLPNRILKSPNFPIVIGNTWNSSTYQRKSFSNATIIPQLKNFCNDLLLSIFDHLDLEQRAIARLVCKRWQTLIDYSRRNCSVEIRSALAPLAISKKMNVCSCCFNKSRHLITIANTKQLKHYQRKLAPMVLGIRCLQLHINNISQPNWLTRLLFLRVSNNVDHLQVQATYFDESLKTLIQTCSKSIKIMELYLESCDHSAQALAVWLLNSLSQVTDLTVEVVKGGNKSIHIDITPCNSMKALQSICVLQHQTTSNVSEISESTVKLGTYFQLLQQLRSHRKLQSIRLSNSNVPDLKFLARFMLTNLQQLCLDELCINNAEQLLLLASFAELRRCEINGHNLLHLNLQQVYQTLHKLTRTMPFCEFVWNHNLIANHSIQSKLETKDPLKSVTFYLQNQQQTIDRLHLHPQQQQKLFSVSPTLSKILITGQQLQTLAAHLQFVRVLHLQIHFCAVPLHVLASCKYLHTLSLTGKCCTKGCAVDLQLQSLLPALRKCLQNFSLTGTFRFQRAATLKTFGMCHQLNMLDLQPQESESSINVCSLNEQTLNKWFSLTRLGFLMLNRIGWENKTVDLLVRVLNDEQIWPELRFMSMQNAHLSKDKSIQLIKAIQHRALNCLEEDIQLELNSDELISELEQELPNNLKLQCIT